MQKLKLLESKEKENKMKMKQPGAQSEAKGKVTHCKLIYP